MLKRLQLAVSVTAETAEEADEAYTYEWALNPADVTKLLYL